MLLGLSIYPAGKNKIIRSDAPTVKPLQQWPLVMINQSIILFLPKSAYIENKFDSRGQKKETMAKRYTLVHALEKNLD